VRAFVGRHGIKGREGLWIRGAGDGVWMRVSLRLARVKATENSDESRNDNYEINRELEFEAEPAAESNRERRGDDCSRRREESLLRLPAYNIPLTTDSS